MEFLELSKGDIVYLKRYCIEAVFKDKDKNVGRFKTLGGEQVKDWLTQDRVERLTGRDMEATLQILQLDSEDELRHKILNS